MKIYVGNLSYETNEEELKSEFLNYGKVDSIAIPLDRYSGRPRGFAFVEMPSISEGQAAIQGLNGKTLNDRTLVVNAARDRSGNRGGRSFGGGRNSNFRSGRGGQRRY